MGGGGAALPWRMRHEWIIIAWNFFLCEKNRWKLLTYIFKYCIIILYLNKGYDGESSKVMDFRELPARCEGSIGALWRTLPSLQKNANALVIRIARICHVTAKKEDSAWSQYGWYRGRCLSSHWDVWHLFLIFANNNFRYIFWRNNFYVKNSQL